MTFLDGFALSFGEVLVKKGVSLEDVDVTETPILTPSTTFTTDSLPSRPLTSTSSVPSSTVSLTLHPTATAPGLIVKVNPPRAPPSETARTPCDIVLSIDVSASMDSPVPVPGGGDDSELPDYGFSILDLTKHAALTILETLDENDRIGIVTFSTRAKVVQTLEAVTPAHKSACRESILALRPVSMTNLWQGITKGLSLFEEGGETGRNPALLVLTDGMPNSGCPPQGYVPKLLQRESLPAAIHTFGFGHDLQSGLLKSIADVAGGSFAYIPDSSMLGTVFIHAVATLQSTYATNLTLKFRCPSSLDLNAKEPMGIIGAGTASIEVEEDGRKLTEFTLNLGHLQYGQSRDIFFSSSLPVGTTPAETQAGISPAEQLLDATVTYSPVSDVRMNDTHTILASLPSTLATSPSALALAPEEEAYHISRAQVCAAIGSLFRLKPDNEQVLANAADSVHYRTTRFSSLPQKLPASSFPNNERCASLLKELDGTRDGQIPLAATGEYFGTWGAHYLLGLKSAHEKQVCNSFKDPGPLMYAVDSPLFKACVARLDDVFDGLEPPPPSLETDYMGPRDMGVYRNVAGPCFAGETPVRLAGDGAGNVLLRDLTCGMAVETPRGARAVLAVLKTPVEGQIVCRVGDVLVTPWHPVSTDSGKSWVFPAEVTEGEPARYTGAVYSVLLEGGDEPAGHALALGEQGLWGVTLGHGVIAGEGDVRAHAFLGDHAAVRKSLEGLEARNGARGDGVVVCGGVKKDGEGLVCGFVQYVPVAKSGREMSAVEGQVGNLDGLNVSG
ncbi:uncharacterized protein DNG_10172 [Cephalotrichum gorgonifer]|uniref:VWFA domain-containing protein n=1 Tax=Cephalotrichum gorgonifer TaxID=2041049 RepID=A0AAE8N8Q4_9PEZI|nr:uncharacterized protein DNG_10172 [Cephalotrichum gorgonifer]